MLLNDTYGLHHFNELEGYQDTSDMYATVTNFYYGSTETFKTDTD